MNRKLILILTLVLTASIALDIVLQLSIGYVPSWLIWAKLTVLCIMYLGSFINSRLRKYAAFSLVLTAITGVNILTGFIQSSAKWQCMFDTHSFVGNFESSILLKILGVIPILIILYAQLGSWSAFYLCKGDLNRKADPINWLGIAPNRIAWGKLAIISAVLISLGTILLTILTVIHVANVRPLTLLLKYFPFIVLLALANSFCEGVLFRSAVLGTLKNRLGKNQLVLVAAIFFGIGHFYGAPGGFVGMVMSGLLGWYMCRSMYETKGFTAAWIIHFMQDLVIFSTIFLLGNFSV